MGNKPAQVSRVSAEERFGDSDDNSLNFKSMDKSGSQVKSAKLEEGK